MARNSIQRYQASAQIADTPDFVVGGGEMAQALQALGGNVAGRLKQMADRAAAKEGELAGLNAGQVAGANYLERQDALGSATPAKADGVNAGLLERLEALQKTAGVNLPVISGYRDPARNAKVGGAKGSQHLHGNAVDIDVSALDQAARIKLIEQASQQGITGIGVYNNSLHFDLGGRRAWGGTYKRESVPAWAEPAILAHLTAQGGVPQTTAEPVATGGLNPQPLALRNDNTIFGDAFDAAATRAYGWRMQQGLSTDLGNAYEQFKDDPAGWQNAAAGIRDRYLEDEALGDPQLREAFDKSFVERTEAYGRSILQRREQALLAEQQSAFADGMDAQRADLEKQAFLLGANPDADAILSSQANRILNQISVAEAANVITPAQAKAQRDQLDTTMAYSRTHGVFNSLPTPAAKQAFANDLLTDWADNEGPLTGLNFNQVKALSDQLAAQALGAQNKLQAENKAEIARVEGLIEADIASIASTGIGLDTAANDLTPDRLAALGMDASVWQAGRDRARQRWEATAGMEVETPAELNDRLRALEPQPGSADFVRQGEIYADAVKRAQDVLKERETDPLGQASRAGAIALEPIDMSTADTMEAGLSLRRQQGDAVGSMYGIAPTYFRAEERTQIANAMLDNPEMVPGFAVTLSETFGDRAPRALAELSDAAPELAHAAGIVMATGDSSVALDVARVMTGRRDKTLNIKMPTDAVMTTAAQAIVGPAMALNPGTRASVLNIAGMLFEKEAAALGFEPSDIKEPGSAAWQVYQHSMNRALGASQHNGVQYGGIAQVNGAPIVAPTSMAAESVEGLLRSVRDSDLVQMAPMRSGNGVAIGAADLAGARLLTIGDGQYAVALGDPASLTPNIVQGEDGQPWVLDLYQLEEIARTRPTESGADLFSLPVFWRR